MVGPVGKRIAKRYEIEEVVTMHVRDYDACQVFEGSVCLKVCQHASPAVHKQSGVFFNDEKTGTGLLRCWIGARASQRY